MENTDHTLLNILSTGCDERIFLREETNANKYHLNPLNYKNLLNRGSCTCGTLTPFGHEVAVEFLIIYDLDLPTNYKFRIVSANQGFS